MDAPSTMELNPQLPGGVLVQLLVTSPKSKGPVTEKPNNLQAVRTGDLIPANITAALKQSKMTGLHLCTVTQLNTTSGTHRSRVNPAVR